MNPGHGANVVIGEALIKCGQQELHRCVTVTSDDRGPQKAAGFGVEDDLHNPACLADLDSTAVRTA